MEEEMGKEDQKEVPRCRFLHDLLLMLLLLLEFLGNFCSHMLPRVHLSVNVKKMCFHSIDLRHRVSEVCPKIFERIDSMQPVAKLW